MFSKQQPEAIAGDVVGEALVEVRERIEKYGWRRGGDITGLQDPMCLGNHIGVVVEKKGKWVMAPTWLLNYGVAPWEFFHMNELGRQLTYALGFPDSGYLTSWNDRYYFFFGRWRGKRASLKRINAAIEEHNAAIINSRRRKKEQIIRKGMDIGKPVREIEAPAPVEIPIEEPEVEKEPEREPEKVPV